MDSSPRHLTTDQYEQARTVLSRAFFDYPLMQYTLPDESQRHRGVKSLYGAVLADCLRYGDVDSLDDVSAVACWLRPGTGMPGIIRQFRAGFLTLPFHFGLRGLQRLMAYGGIADKLHHQHAPEHHWYLAAIGVEPERQRQGFASRLLEPRLHQADRDGSICYLDTHLAGNVRLYERHGFRVMWEGPAPGHTLTIWSMRREPPD